MYTILHITSGRRYIHTYNDSDLAHSLIAILRSKPSNEEMSIYFNEDNLFSFRRRFNEYKRIYPVYKNEFELIEI